MPLVAYDTFTGPNGTNIQDRTSDSGNDWVKRDQMAANNFTIQSNQIERGGSALFRGYRIDIDPGDDEYEAEIEGRIDGAFSPTINDAIIVNVRMDDDPSDDTWYSLRFDGSGLQIHRYISGSFTEIADNPAITLAANTPYTLRLYTAINSSGDVVLEGYVNGVLGVSFVDASGSKITARGSGGFGCVTAGGAGRTVVFDNFRLLTLFKFDYEGEEEPEEEDEPFTFESVLVLNYEGEEEVEEEGAFTLSYLKSPPYIENPAVVILVDFPDDDLYFASAEIETGGHRYYDMLADIPSISESIPEFWAGILPPQQTTIYLENLKDEISDLRKAGKLKRGNRVLVKELWTGNNIEPETIDVYQGIIDYSAPSTDIFQINCTGIEEDVFGIMFPDGFVDTEKWPNAHADDLGAPVGFFVGSAKKVPCALVKSQDDESGIDYRYLCGEGDIDVDAVYRDGRFMTVYEGTFQSGSTTTVWRLAASDTRSNDFYKDLWITNNANGQTRRITAFLKSTKGATVTPSGTAPTAGQTYTIRRWNRITEVHGGKTYTLIQFAIAMIDQGAKLTRQNITADLSGYQAERVPVLAMKNLLSRYTDKINEAAFDAAAAVLAAIPELRADGGAYEPRQMNTIIEELCLIGRTRLDKDPEGYLFPIVDGTQNTIAGPFKLDNMSGIGVPREAPLDTVWKDLTLQFRRQFDRSEYTLKTSPHDVLPSEGRISPPPMQFDFLFNKESADMVCDYLAKVKRNYDKMQPFSLADEGRDVRNGDVLDISLPEYNRAGLYEVTARRAQGISIEVDTSEYDAGRTEWEEGELLDDPVGDNIADFSNTPPDEVTSFAASWTITALNISAKAALSWVKPSQNWKEVKIEYKRSVDLLWTEAGRSSGTSFDIPGLSPGINYDFRATSVSIDPFNLEGGAAQISASTAPGDTTAPLVPTGLTGSVKFNIAEYSWNQNTEADLAGYEWDLRTGPNGGGSLIDSGFTADNHLTKKLTDGALTANVTRHFRVRAVDNTAKTTGSSATKSAYSSSVSLSIGDTTAIQQLDIKPGEIVNQERSTVPNVGTWVNNEELITCAITKRAGTRIRIEFSGNTQNSTGVDFVNMSLRLVRTSTNVQSPFVSVATPANSVNSLAGVYDDNWTSAGSFTYKIVANVSSISLTGSSFNLRLIEYVAHD